MIIFFDVNVDVDVKPNAVEVQVDYVVGTAFVVSSALDENKIPEVLIEDDFPWQSLLFSKNETI